MRYRQVYTTTEELAAWYSAKYREMGGTWVTPPEECNKHLDDLGVPFDKSKSLLDVGCGGGHFLVEAEKRVTCIGLEVSTVAKQFAEARLQQTPILVQSIESTPFADAFDYIVSIGSLEHIIELDKALDEIRRLLTLDGRWYFYVPNEAWKYDDQPNERTATDDEWEALFAAHGLITNFRRRWNDSTAFAGRQ